MILTRFSELIREYHRLGAGDVFVGQVPSSYLKSVLLSDLNDRGVRLLPPATAQLINRSKVAQAFILNPWMAPHTIAITRRRELMAAITAYHRHGISIAVTKADRMHCGHGVRKWDNLETLYNCLAFDEKALPMVLQPYIAEFTDVRVVMVGDFHEAYNRRNEHNFRRNLAGGGQSEPYALDHAQLAFCRQVMARARMPYAHIDLMLLPEGKTCLFEIRLNGGAHGARIESDALDRMKLARLQQLAEQAHAEKAGPD